jgi:hypothetical protein
LEPPVKEPHDWKTSSRISTSAMETITNEAPRTRRLAMPIGTARAATRSAPAIIATQGFIPVSRISRPVP